jgi:hypothetical protein
VNVEELVRALERRAIDRSKVVVVETRGSMKEVVGVRHGDTGLFVLRLWKPPTYDLGVSQPI